MIPRYIIRMIAISGLLLVVGTARSQGLQKKKYGDKELNALMAQVWQNNEHNLDNLRNYVFSEKEVWENGLKQLKVADYASFQREYIWVIRDGELVRPWMHGAFAERLRGANRRFEVISGSRETRLARAVALIVALGPH